MSEDAVSASARGATFLIALQIGSRAITFALNQILLRFLSPQLLGVSVQLELYVIATLYFSRESFRIAAQRRSDGGPQAAINLTYLAIGAGLPIGVLFAHILQRSTPPDTPFFHLALRMDELAAMIELCSEPGFVIVGQYMLYKVRARAEATAVVMKTIATAALVFWAKCNGLELGVLPFAAGELAYATSLAAVYLSQTAAVAQSHGVSLLPVKMKSRCVHSSTLKRKDSTLIFPLQPRQSVLLVLFFQATSITEHISLRPSWCQVCPHARRLAIDRCTRIAARSGHVRSVCELWWTDRQDDLSPD